MIPPLGFTRRSKRNANEFVFRKNLIVHKSFIYRDRKEKSSCLFIELARLLLTSESDKGWQIKKLVPLKNYFLTRFHCMN